ncbi:PQQ-dependent dehydrogenase, methanol/ethanol family [Acetobacter sp.]|jgi:alcohol dehydrogenase (cytochrome c)|uniref:PQQ-dependent dehydrogenase, methanol/ethanol family n=1 Tax=Acetobacter sp. TaxID=440 RepID=UPI0025C3C428|nr:PQQ-dependent dehydrogenase, methanol/ethanol family [Acetobacter sp.]MCH4092257.1 PQQ-dependent dehydrogenase, methanol/ethanol family [Acetobacter sp.]MCI1299826.1 PQQ-dependent dehydrogenase, methanol/ethanol family [Acetobacter sp.]MCI1315844.1 PQQ-dependent dehydrogenase, methanol/ethanol family [Acetobacter sp.]
MSRPSAARKTSFLGLLAAGTILAAALGQPTGAARAADDQGATGEAIIHADDHPENWLSYGRTYSEQRYSPLDQINRQNVGDLKLAWFYEFDSNRGQEGTPLIVDGVLFASTNWSKVKALKADTGELLWAFDPKVPGNVAVRGCCDTVNRGIAYWNGKIYVGTFDGRLIALDAKTGKVVWSVNTIPKDAALGNQRSYTVDGAPRIAKGRVIIGNGGAEFGARGFVSAFDAETGKLDWRFFTVPNPKNEPDHAASDSVLMTKAYKTWSPNGSWTKQGGGGTVWDSIVYDPQTDLVYLAVGNGSPWNYKYRSNGIGDNLFLGSIVAVKPETGEYVWHFQATPMDQWDYTSVQQIMTLDLPINGETRHVIVHAPKNGFFYVLDAKTGQFIQGKNYVYENWAYGLDPKTGRPIYNPEGLYTLNGKEWYGIPGPLGAHNFMEMAYSPRTHLIYLPAHQIPFGYKNQSGGFKAHPDSWNLGLDMTKTGLPDTPEARAAYMQDLKGWLLAWDPVKLQAQWTIERAGGWDGGVLATGGDLVFQGLATGEFHAYDATDGKDLFKYDLQSGIIANPVTYSVNGKQYVAIEVGWGGIYPISMGGMSRTAGWTVNHSYIAVFSLDGKAKLPTWNSIGFLPVKPPAEFDEKTVDKGYFQYQTYCQTCHGDNAEAGGMLPDLRWSGAIRHKDAFYNVVGRGALTAYGMDRFDTSMTPDEIESIRNYLIKRATDTYEREIEARKNPNQIPTAPALGITP